MENRIKRGLVARVNRLLQANANIQVCQIQTPHSTDIKAIVGTNFCESHVPEGATAIILTVGKSGSNHGFLGPGVGGVDPLTLEGNTISYLGAFGEFWMRLSMPQIPGVTEIQMVMLGRTVVLTWDGTDRYDAAWPVSIWAALAPYLGFTTKITLKPL